MNKSKSLYYQLFLILPERVPRTNAVPIWVNAFFRAARWNG